MEIGDVVHGFAGGFFGRDSYDCRELEEKGPDWLLFRNKNGQVELFVGNKQRQKGLLEYKKPNNCECLDDQDDEG